jgi:hypothetical protein
VFSESHMIRSRVGRTDIRLMTNSPSSIHSTWRRTASAIAPLLHQPKSLYLFFLAYLITLACLLDYQSLWVDEITQILGTRSGILDHTEQLTRTGTGGPPLGWLPQAFAIHWLGYSTAVARLPSALAAAGTFLVVFFIAKELSLRYPLVPAILLSVLPLNFRYALEGRPYAQGLFFSALATLVFLQLFKRLSIPLFIAYAFVLTLGIYSQPFTFFTACSHFVWALSVAREHRRLVFLSGVALALTAMAFLPWYVYASPLVRQTMQSSGLHFYLTWKTPSMLIREITGAGYVGSAILLLLAAIGLYKSCVSAAMKWLLIVCSVVPIVCVLLMDALFGYFLAIRQMIFILPPLVLLASDGLSALMHSTPRRVLAATALLTIVFVYADIGWLRRPREDWSLAARALVQLSTENSACTLYAPPGALDSYELFEPQLASSVCPSGPAGGGSVILVISPYATEADRLGIRELLKGKQAVVTRTVGMSTIQVFR